MDFLPNIDPFRQRYNELEEQLSDPIIFKDAVLAAELSRDHGRVKGIIEAFEEIKVLEAQLEETEGLLSDEEFAEAAQEEIDSLQVKIKNAFRQRSCIRKGNPSVRRECYNTGRVMF